MADDVVGYYRSERNTAFTFIGRGVVSAGVGTGLVATRGDFATGLGVAMISIGALEALGSTFYAFQVGAEVDHYSGVLAPSLPRSSRATSRSTSTGPRRASSGTARASSRWSSQARASRPTAS